MEAQSYLHKFNCMSCGLHFIVCSWRKDWPYGSGGSTLAADTVRKECLCPECGSNAPKIQHVEESNSPIYEHVPGAAKLRSLKGPARPGEWVVVRDVRDLRYVAPGDSRPSTSAVRPASNDISRSAMRNIRWVLVLPAALVALTLSALLVHLVVMATLGGRSAEPLIVIEDPATLKSIKLLIQGFVGPFAFVLAGTWTAPAQRLAVSIVLSVTAFLCIAVLYLWLDAEGYRLQPGLVTTLLLNLAGCSAAIIAAWVNSRE